MRRPLLVLAIITSLMVLSILPLRQASAFTILDGACDGATSESEVCTSSGGNPVSGTNGVILRVVDIVSFIIGVAAVIMVILGGLKYITANGDANSLSSAKNTILYAIIGVVVAAFANIIIRFIIRVI